MRAERDSDVFVKQAEQLLPEIMALMISELYPSYSALITKFKIMRNLTSILDPMIEDVGTRIDVLTWLLQNLHIIAESSSVNLRSNIDSEFC